MSLTNITLATESRAFVGQPLNAKNVRFVLTAPWVDQPIASCLLDGDEGTLGDRVLLTAQMDPTQNGIFTLGLTRNGSGILAGFFNSAAPGDNYRTLDPFNDGDTVVATDGRTNRGIWLAGLSSTWAPDRTPIFFGVAPKGYGVTQRLIRLTQRVACSSAAMFLGQLGTGSGLGVRYSQLLAALSQSIASVFIAPPVKPPP